MALSPQQQITKLCDSAKHYDVPYNTAVQTDGSNKMMKITMGRNSNLEFLGSNCLVFLRGRGDVECFGKNNEFYVHHLDKDLIEVISRHGSNTVSFRYSLPEFQPVEVTQPQPRSVRSATIQGTGNSNKINAARNQEASPLLDRGASHRNAVSPQTAATPQRASTVHGQRIQKVEMTPLPIQTIDAWASLNLASLGFGGLQYCSIVCLLSGSGILAHHNSL